MAQRVLLSEAVQLFYGWGQLFLLAPTKKLTKETKFCLLVLPEGLVLWKWHDTLS